MHWYGHEKITKYYSIGFTDKETQEIEAAYEKAKLGIFHFRNRTSFIKHLALSCIILEKENQRLKNTVKETQAQSEAMGQSETSEETDLTDAWTGYYRGIKKKENVIYPEWG